MEVYYFLVEEVENLRSIPYVIQVSNKAITYAEGFKQHFINELGRRKLPTQISRKTTFDTTVIGKDRIQRFSRRVSISRDQSTQNPFETTLIRRSRHHLKHTNTRMKPFDTRIRPGQFTIQTSLIVFFYVY